MSLNPKSWLQSKTCVSAVLTIVCLMLGASGRHVDKELLEGTLTEGKELGLALGGIAASCTAFWARMHAWQWHRPNIKEPSFWMALAGVVSAIGALFQLPVDDLAKAITDVGALVVSGKVVGVITSLTMLYGAVVAKQEIKTARATPLPLILMLCLALSSCSVLSAEQKAKLEQQAITAATAAATAAAKGALDGKSTKQIATDAARAAVDALQQVNATP